MRTSVLQFVVPHNLYLTLFSPSSVNVMPPADGRAVGGGVCVLGAGRLRSSPSTGSTHFVAPTTRDLMRPLDGDVASLNARGRSRGWCVYVSASAGPNMRVNRRSGTRRANYVTAQRGWGCVPRSPSAATHSVWGAPLGPGCLATRPLPRYVIEVSANGLKDWLKSRTVGLCMALNRPACLDFHAALAHARAYWHY